MKDNLNIAIGMDCDTGSPDEVAVDSGPPTLSVIPPDGNAQSNHIRSSPSWYALWAEAGLRTMFTASRQEYYRVMPDSTESLLPQLLQLDVSHEQYSVEAVDTLLSAAQQHGASDLHLQPRSDGWQVLLRVDGVLSQVGFLNRSDANDPVTRLMVLARLPTYRSSQPMEGRLRWKQASDALSMRLGVYPTVHGPRAVIRFLRRESELDDLDSLGLADDVASDLVDCSRQTDGAILLSGPAGSGKTTTLYAVLRQIASTRPRRSVMTIEDPVESLIDTISQSELDISGGMTLASALRSAVRQDSEVLLVSEIRDPETAEAALQAALTGQLVFRRSMPAMSPPVCVVWCSWGPQSTRFKAAFGRLFLSACCERFARRVMGNREHQMLRFATIAWEQDFEDASRLRSVCDSMAVITLARH